MSVLNTKMYENIVKGARAKSFLSLLCAEKYMFAVSERHKRNDKCLKYHTYDKKHKPHFALSLHISVIMHALRLICRG